MARVAKLDFDVVVIGAGVKGSAIARDAVGRGLRVLVCEQDDLGSSCIKSLARMGMAAFQSPIEYTYEDAQKANHEWEILRRISPHLSSAPKAPPKVGLQALFARIQKYGTTNAVLDVPLQTILSGHRFVMANLRDAAERGASVLPRTRFTSATRKAEFWSISIAATNGALEEHFTTRILVNTTEGDSVTSGLLSVKTGESGGICGTLAIVKDLENEQAPTLQEGQQERFFSIPLEQGCRLIGILRDREDAATLAELLDHAKSACGKTLDVTTVLWHGQTVLSDREFSVKPVQDLDSYNIHIQTDTGKLPLFQITGGTLPSARRLAEDTVAEMAPFASMIGKQWTHTSTLPGGDFEPALRNSLIAKFGVNYPFLSEHNMERLFDSYGTDCTQLLGHARCEEELGTRFGDDLYAAEVDWLVRTEWAKTAEDIVWRRTRLGQKMTAQQIEALQCWMVDKYITSQ